MRLWLLSRRSMAKVVGHWLKTLVSTGLVQADRVLTKHVISSCRLSWPPGVSSDPRVHMEGSGCCCLSLCSQGWSLPWFPRLRGSTSQETERREKPGYFSLFLPLCQISYHEELQNFAFCTNLYGSSFYKNAKYLAQRNLFLQLWNGYKNIKHF